MVTGSNSKEDVNSPKELRLLCSYLLYALTQRKDFGFTSKLAYTVMYFVILKGTNVAGAQYVAESGSGFRLKARPLYRLGLHS